MKKALQLYSVRDAVEADFEGTLAAVAKMGYDGVEFAGLYGKTPEEVRTLCEKYGLVAVSAHVGFGEMLENENVFSDYKKIGCEYIAVPYLPPEDMATEQARREIIEKVRALSEKANGAGLKMLYHNHDHELLKLNGRSFLDELYAAIPTPPLSPEFDVCWLHFAGEDPAAYLKRRSSRVKVVHLKDCVVFDGAERPSFRPLGRGVVDIPAVVKAAEELGAEWFVVEQDDPTEGEKTLDEARVSAEFLRTLENSIQQD